MPEVLLTLTNYLHMDESLSHNYKFTIKKVDNDLIWKITKKCYK